MKQEETYRTLTDHINKLLPVDRIYLLGERSVEYSTSSIFIDELQTQKCIDHLYLLVIVPENKTERKHVIEEKIENNCAELVKVTVIVIDSNQFDNWASSGHRFIKRVQQGAELLIANKQPEFTDLDNLASSRQLMDNGIGYALELNKVNEFMAGADLYRIRKQNRMAAFMLHQTVEHALLTIFSVSTGLHINSHNLYRLSRYCSMVYPEILVIFNRTTEKEKRSIQLLQRAYIESRYGNGISIDGEELNTMFDAIDAVNRILEELMTQSIR